MSGDTLPAKRVGAFVAGERGGVTVVDPEGRTGTRLQQFLDRLETTSPFYGTRLATCGGDTATQRLGRLPATSRGDYRGPLAAEALAGLGREPFVTDRSSGSTSRPVLRFCRGADDLAEQAETERVFRRAGFGPGDHLVCIDVGAANIYDFYQRAARALGVARFTFLHLTEDDAPAWLALERLEPTAVLTIPSLIARGGERPLTLWPDRRSPVRVCITVGELLAPGLRAAISHGWDCAVHTFFGTTETGGFASECVMADGCHFHPDSAVVGVASPTWVDPLTVEGELLLSTPEIRTQAVLNYRTGDRVRVTVGACACGEPTPRLWPLGRDTETFVFAGEKFTYDVFLEALRAVAPTLDACSILVGPATQRPVRLTFHLPETLRRHEPALRSALTNGIFELDALCRYGMVEVELVFQSRLPLGNRKGIRLAAAS